MAVTKMKKLTIITDSQLQSTVLKAIQGIQNVEVRDVFTESASNQWVETYFEAYQPSNEQTKAQALQLRLKKISESLVFIEHNATSKAKKKDLKRHEVDLMTLEAQYDAKEIDQELSEILDLKEKWQAAQTNQDQLLEKEAYYSKWQALDSLPLSVTSQTKTMHLGVLASENWEAFQTQIKQLDFVYLEEVYQDEAEIGIALVYLNEVKEQVNEVCRQFSFRIETYEEIVLPKEKLVAVKHSIQKGIKKLKQLTKEIGNKKGSVQKLQLAEEVILASLEREKIIQRVIQTEHLFVLQGWVGEMDVPALLAALRAVIKEDEFYVTFEAPDTSEIEQEVPTKLSNHPLVRPFEMLTEMYSLPKYGEIDPTPWFVPFFLVFFGMMVADLGYGLLMLVGTTVALSRLVLPRGMARFMRFFQVLALPTMLWGLIYNSFFGLQMPYTPILSTTNDVITILLLSVIFGFIQILVGLSLNVKENLRKKEYITAIADGFAWQGILIGIVISLVGKMLLNQPVLFISGISLIVLSALIIVLAPLKTTKSPAKAIAKGAYNLYGLTSYIGDLVSYTRLMALGISGGSIAAAFNMLVDFMPPIAKFSVGIVLIIALHGLNIFLSLLGAYVHGARLQYVEFFGKFYQGGGRAFAPLKTKEKYVNIEQTKNK